METLESIDRSIVSFVNAVNGPWMDEFMWAISGKVIWIPVYLLLIYVVFKNVERNQFYLFLIGVGASVALADFTSSQIIKVFFERYRPSHHAILTEKLHFYQMSNGEFYKGGMFGFVSNHATNFAAICSWAYFMLKGKQDKIVYLAIFLTLLVGYSRLYLGVHYLSDVIGGYVLGICLSSIFYLALFKYKRAKR
jgi:undecaprenyl-diphosphatase